MLFNVCCGADGDQVSWKVYNIKLTMYSVLFLMKYTYISMLGLNCDLLSSVWILQHIKFLIVAVYQVVLLLNQALCANIQYLLEQCCPQV